MCGFLQKVDLIKFYSIQKLSCDKVAKILGCGKTTVLKYLKKYTIPRRKRIAYGYPCRDNSYNWKGGISKHQRGYVLRFMPNHPKCNQRGYVFEHRLIIEKQIGRYLHKWEVVHHINKRLDDNKIENLKLYPSQSLHLSAHFKKLLLFVLFTAGYFILNKLGYTYSSEHFLPLFAGCGFFGHGFYWEGEKTELAEAQKDFTVIFDFEINSHSKIREYRKIPSGAIRIGFNPVNGEAVNNDSLPLPLAVKEKAGLLFQLYFPCKENIADWIKKNYGVQGDKDEWNFPLLKMLNDGGAGLFSKAYHEQGIKNYEQRIKDYEQWIKNYEQEIKNYEQRIEDYKQRIKDYEQWIKDYKQRIKENEQGIKEYEKEIKDYEQTIKWYEQEIKNYEQRIKDCERWIKDCEQWIKDCEQWIKDCEQWIKDCEQWIKDCSGTLDQMDIGKFIAYFLVHPNSYWAERTNKRK